MRLVTFVFEDQERIGALINNDDGIVDLSATGDACFASMLALIEAGPAAWQVARETTARAAMTHFTSAVSLRAPIPLPPQYRDAMTSHQHIRQSLASSNLLRSRLTGNSAQIAAAEAARGDFPIPDVHLSIPVYYKGNRFAISGPDEDIPWPTYSKLMDFELELACVIGTGGKDIPRHQAMEHVFGFTILNDFSARDAQGVEMAGLLGPAKGKDFDKANCFGPCLVTLDEIDDPHRLRMQARVNGETWCDNNSSTMHWRFEDLIARISEGETLYPGEIIGAGTIGNGCGLERLRFLEDGDIVELEIERIGILRNRVIRQDLQR